MIIWGSKAREKTVSTGTFFCPGCMDDREYALRRVSRYFTLYFIPLFPTETLGEFVACEICSSQYEPQILELSEMDIRVLRSPWTCGQCGNVNQPDNGTCVSCGAARGT